MPTPPYAISVTHTDDTTTVAVTGEVDAFTSPVLASTAEQAISDHNPARLIVDFAEVTFCDSSGLGALLRIRAHTTRTDTPFDLINVSDNVYRVLTITGLVEVFPTARTSQPATEA